MFLLAAESDSDIIFSLSRLGFTVHEVTILENNRKSKSYFLESVVNSHIFDHF